MGEPWIGHRKLCRLYHWYVEQRHLFRRVFGRRESCYVFGHRGHDHDPEEDFGQENLQSTIVVWRTATGEAAKTYSEIDRRHHVSLADITKDVILGINVISKLELTLHLDWREETVIVVVEEGEFLPLRSNNVVLGRLVDTDRKVSVSLR